MKQSSERVALCLLFADYWWAWGTEWKMEQLLWANGISFTSLHPLISPFLFLFLNISGSFIPLLIICPCVFFSLFLSPSRSPGSLSIRWKRSQPSSQALSFIIRVGCSDPYIFIQNISKGKWERKAVVAPAAHTCRRIRKEEKENNELLLLLLFNHLLILWSVDWLLVCWSMNHFFFFFPSLYSPLRNHEHDF